MQFFQNGCDVVSDTDSSNQSSSTILKSLQAAELESCSPGQAGMVDVSSSVKSDSN